MKLRCQFGTLSAVLVSLLVLGCAGTRTPNSVVESLNGGQPLHSGDHPAGVEQTHPSADEDALALRHRAAEYWDARTKGDYCLQLKLSEPRLQGRTTCEEYARGKGAIQYLGYDVGDARITSSFGNVQVKVVGRITLPGSQAKAVVKTATVSDAWIKVDGVWYRRADQGEGRPTMSEAIQ